MDIVASVLLKLILNGNERCYTTYSPSVWAELYDPPEDRNYTYTINVVLDDNAARHAATVNNYIVNMVKGCVIIGMEAHHMLEE